MAPKKGGAKTVNERTESSKAAPTDAEVEAEANATAVTAMTAIPQAQPPSSQSQIGGMVEPGARANTPEGFVQDVPFDQDGNEDEDEDGKITEHAMNLKRLDDYQEEIQTL
jgi:hypothetical protein